MGSRDHSETCGRCGFERGGMNDLLCACDHVGLAEVVAERDRLSAELQALKEEHADLCEQRQKWLPKALDADRLSARVRELESAAKDNTTLPTNLMDRIVAKSEGRCLGTIGDGFVVCGEGGNYCSEACRLRARVRELELTGDEMSELSDLRARVSANYDGMSESRNAAHLSVLNRLLDRLVKGGR